MYESKRMGKYWTRYQPLLSRVRTAWPERFGGRALRNAYFDEWVGRESELALDDAAHHAVVEARRVLDPDIAPLYAGQGVGALTDVRSAADVVRHLAGASDLLRDAASSF